MLLEDPDVVSRVRSDPRTFLEELSQPVILDEIQNAPELLNYIRARIDAAPSKNGRWLLTGSQEAPLMRGVTESMAGRAIMQLLPLSRQEDPRVSWFIGGFPEVLARPRGAPLWFQSYLQTAKLRELIRLGGDAVEGPWDGEEGITLLADLEAGATGTMPGGGYPDGIRLSSSLLWRAGQRRRLRFMRDGSRSSILKTANAVCLRQRH